MGHRQTRLALVLTVLACRGPFNPVEYNPDWTTPTHGLSEPDYGVVFPQDSVNRIDIIMTAAAWTAVRQDMVRVWGFDFGDNRTTFGAFPEDEPGYVDVLVRFNGRTWKHVGFRLKGNATLQFSWNTGNYKLPFRLKFDAFAEQYPETWRQRFHGFTELSMANNAHDESLLREKTGDDVFRMAGVPAARSAYYRVYLDIGQGLVYNGVYTMVEVIEDTMLRDQLGENTGNLYKPESTFQTFVASEFQRQNNKASTDYSDVQAMITALNNNGLRTANPAQWRAGLEAVFDVDHFLKYLAVNTAMGSPDAYGVNAHNHFLYNHSSRKLIWIPWDQNASFYEGLSYGMTEVSSAWPLIRYLIDDPVYFARYRAHLQTFHDAVFTPATMDALFDKHHRMIAPYVTGPDGELPGRTFTTSGSFPQALREFKEYVTSRRRLLQEFLGRD